MRLPETAHTSRPWRIHEIAGDFELEDVWALPTPGARDDFPALVELVVSFDGSRSSSTPVRALFAIRSKLGELLGLDRDEAGLGGRVSPLREQVPADLRATAPPASAYALPVTPLYSLDDEWAAEIANQTVHGVIHLGWVPDEAGAYRGQLAILVKRNGLLGTAYMAAITPFRHLLVYPAIMQELRRTWRQRG